MCIIVIVTHHEKYNCVLISHSLINNTTDDIEEADLAATTIRVVLPPSAHCVAAANGWIVAVVECSPPIVPSPSPPPPHSSSSSHSGSMTQLPPPPPQSKQSLTQYIPPLRMVSRWNVRRGGSSAIFGSDGNYLAPLPPPIRPIGLADMDATTSTATTTSTHPRGGSGMMGSSTTTNDPDFGRIEHTFVDPTGCHVLLSSRNGELYYLHSTSKNVVKLNGFGPCPDGSYNSSSSSSSSGGGGFRPGLTLAEVLALLIIIIFIKSKPHRCKLLLPMAWD